MIFHYIEKNLTGQAQESAMALLFLRDANEEKTTQKYFRWKNDSSNCIHKANGNR